jgi:L-lactate dehydrogenase complex protein LldE
VRLPEIIWGERAVKVSLFIPCLVEQFHPAVGEATARVLARAGVDLVYPTEQTCCGQPLYKSGHWKQSVQLAHHFMRVFDGAEAIVAPSGSCVSMVRDYYPELLRDDAGAHDRAVEIGKRVYEFTEFLVNVLDAADLGASWRGTAVYHDSCQVSRALGIVREPRLLLSKVRDLNVVEMERPDLCCGFGGTFSLQFPSISEAMVADKVSYILATGAEYLISAEISCLMNIGGYLEKQRHPVRTLHIAEVLNHH